MVYLRHRDARALATTAIKRVTELESLHALPSLDEEQRRKFERLLLEARFGLEQALAQWPENGAAQNALKTVETILEQRTKRASELEREAKERDPLQGAAFRTVGLGGMTLIAAGTAVVASFFPAGQPTPLQMVAFPGITLTMICVGTFFMRHRLLDTRFNREVFACLLASMGFMLFGRIVGLFVETPPHLVFMRDAMVVAAVMAVCAYSMLRWTTVIVLLFAVTAVACAALPKFSMWLFSGATILTMAISTFLSWWLNRLPIPKKA
jgi:hypothetical protein